MDCSSVGWCLTFVSFVPVQSNHCYVILHDKEALLLNIVGMDLQRMYTIVTGSLGLPLCLEVEPAQPDRLQSLK